MQWNWNKTIIMSSRKIFRCRHCGDDFYLSPEDQNDYDNGFIDHEPDCCDECLQMLNHPIHDESETYSDADPGL